MKIWLLVAGAAAFFVVDGDIQVSGGAVLTIIALTLTATQLYFHRVELKRLDKRQQDLGKHNHMWRNNYMLILHSFGAVTRMVAAVAKDEATRHKLSEIEKEVERQLLEIRAEAKREATILYPGGFIEAKD